VKVSLAGSKRSNVSLLVPQIQTASVRRSTWSAYGVSLPRGSIGSSKVRNWRVAGSKRATTPDENPGIQSAPFESKRSRRGAAKGVSIISYWKVSGSSRPMRCSFSWLNHTPPSGATSTP
jgi:hypothetical protein